MIIKLREANIKRLETGRPRTDAELAQDVKEEMESLRRQVDFHPDAVKFSMEVDMLKGTFELDFVCLYCNDDYVLVRLNQATFSALETIFGRILMCLADLEAIRDRTTSSSGLKIWYLQMLRLD